LIDGLVVGIVSALAADFSLHEVGCSGKEDFLSISVSIGSGSTDSCDWAGNSATTSSTGSELLFADDGGCEQVFLSSSSSSSSSSS